ncbi:MAG: 30S ribosomal protein S8 [Coxiella sp. (in: Bacteria)]|nr:MAG: 30S ribosomal protein S8 [Coxiella sp. (in: g-proteobacteria)]
MTMQDPVADMLTRMRNAQAVDKKEVAMPFSKLKRGIAKVLKSEGYIEDWREEGEVCEHVLTIMLKYYEGSPVIDHLSRISKPSLRIYKGKGDLPKVQNGLGIAIVSTSKGVMSCREARRIGEGGEILCVVS